MKSSPTRSLVITFLPRLGAQVRKVAQKQRRSADELVFEACQRHLASLEQTELEEQYLAGYERIPEDVADLEVLVPHLAVPAEEWS